MERITSSKNTDRRIREIARDYMKRGYSVVFAPMPSELPVFLRRFRPDLVAKSDKESVVIEVKSTTGNASQLIEYESLAQAVSQHKGWRFELVLTNPVEQPIASSDVL